MDEIKAKLRELYAAGLVLDIDPTTLGDENLVAILGIDSINALELIVRIEDAFGVQIEDEDFNTNMLDSLDNIGGYIQKRMSDSKATPS